MQLLWRGNCDDTGYMLYNKFIQLGFLSLESQAKPISTKKRISCNWWEIKYIGPLCREKTVKAEWQTAVILTLKNIHKNFFEKQRGRMYTFLIILNGWFHSVFISYIWKIMCQSRIKWRGCCLAANLPTGLMIPHVRVSGVRVLPPLPAQSCPCLWEQQMTAPGPSHCQPHGKPSWGLAALARAGIWGVPQWGQSSACLSLSLSNKFLKIH